jgi:hypothetical protein
MPTFIWSDITALISYIKLCSKHHYHPTIPSNPGLCGVTVRETKVTLLLMNPQTLSRHAQAELSLAGLFFLKCFA